MRRRLARIAGFFVGWEFLFDGVPPSVSGRSGASIGSEWLHGGSNRSTDRCSDPFLLKRCVSGEPPATALMAAASKEGLG